MRAVLVGMLWEAGRTPGGPQPVWMYGPAWAGARLSGRRRMMRTRSPLHTAPPARLANPWARVSFVLAVMGFILGGLEVALLAMLYGHVEDAPDALSTFLVFCLFATIPAGVLAAVFSFVSLGSGAPKQGSARWGRALGLLAIVLGLIGAYLFVGASLNTIGP